MAFVLLAAFVLFILVSIYISVAMLRFSPLGFLQDNYYDEALVPPAGNSVVPAVNANHNSKS